MATAGAGTLSLDEALAAARGNLEVSIAAASAASALAEVRIADQAPPPQLTAKLSQIDLQNGIGSGNLLRDKRIDKSIGIDWTWERGDKRALRTAAARRAAGAAQADVDDVRLQQQLNVLALYFDLLAAQGRTEQLGEIAAGARQTAEVAAKRQAAGDTPLQDRARAEVEAERARLDAQTAQLELRRAQTALAIPIGRDADAAELRVVAPPETTAPAVAEPEIQALIDRRADVRAAAARVEAADAALASAGALRKTDLSWGASVDHYPGTSDRLVELRVQVPLTWGTRYDGDVDRAQAQRRQARDTLERTRRTALSQLLQLQAEREATAQRAARFDAEIVPRSREIAERAELAYRKGAMPLTDVLEARRTLRAVLLDALAARIEHAKAMGAWQLRTRAEP